MGWSSSGYSSSGRDRAAMAVGHPRYKVRFTDSEAYYAAQAIETEFSRIRVQNEKRRFIAIDLPVHLRGVHEAERKLDDQLLIFEQDYGAVVVPDYKYDLDTNHIFSSNNIQPDNPTSPSLDDVLAVIDASGAWNTSTGNRVAIAVVDTGIDGDRLEFPPSKRVGQWQPIGEAPWTDGNGHGTMCACIAAGTRVSGGLFDGVAPDAGVIACKTLFFDTELASIYDYLTGLAQTGLTIVATNSFGQHTAIPPSGPSDSEFIPALDDAIAAGIKVIFSAGNNHSLVGGNPSACGPTSIWLHKCRSDVMTVATCKLDGKMWHYSSRGPGQHYGQATMSQKPDVTAPTPENGRIVYGNKVHTLVDGWGTSGAAPQTAGLAALMLSKNPSLTFDQVFDVIKRTAVPLGHGTDCEGTGLINCRNAVDTV